MVILWSPCGAYGVHVENIEALVIMLEFRESLRSCPSINLPGSMGGMTQSLTRKKAHMLPLCSFIILNSVFQKCCSVK